MRRDAGRVTDADVLQLDVYLARTLEQQVQATSDERIARARLNQLMGEPLSTLFSLDLTPSAIAIDISRPAGLEEDALKNRPEVALAMQQEELAEAGELRLQGEELAAARDQRPQRSTPPWR